jgi:hypothetical protein
MIIGNITEKTELKYRDLIYHQKFITCQSLNNELKFEYYEEDGLLFILPILSCQDFGRLW